MAKPAKAKKPKKAKAKKGKAKKARRAQAMPAGGGLGCCILKPPGEEEIMIPNVTREDCIRRARDIGAVPQWRPGACPED